MFDVLPDGTRDLYEGIVSVTVTDDTAKGELFINVDVDDGSDWLGEHPMTGLFDGSVDFLFNGENVYSDGITVQFTSPDDLDVDIDDAVLYALDDCIANMPTSLMNKVWGGYPNIYY